MKTFLKNVSLFIGLTTIIFGLLTAGFMHYHDLSFNHIPAPNLSESYSYNEKLRFIRNSSIEPNIHVLGSSIALNNIHSETLTERLNSDSFLNFSSFGLSVENAFKLMRIQSKIHKPEKIILVSNTIDFLDRNILFKYTLIEDYLKNPDKNSAIFHLRAFNLNHYISNFPKVSATRKKLDKKLLFDRYGTVNHKKVEIAENNATWNSSQHSLEHQYNYSYLDSLTNYCKRNNIDLIVAQSPHRKELYLNFSEPLKNKLDNHIDTIRERIEKNGHHFIDGSEVLWDDSLFFDGTHFSEEGAAMFTDFIFNKVSEQKY